MPFFAAIQKNHSLMSELLIWNDVYMKGIFRSPTTGKRSSRGLLMKFRRQSFSIFMKTEREAHGALLPFIGAPPYRSPQEISLSAAPRIFTGPGS
jgi:hypothetical protein